MTKKSSKRKRIYAEGRAKGIAALTKENIKFDKHSVSAKRIWFLLYGVKLNKREAKRRLTGLANVSAIKVSSDIEKSNIKEQVKRLTRAKKEWIGFYDSKGWRDIRKEILAMYGETCMVCKKQSTEVEMHVDHIKPRSRFPLRELDITNLQVLCKICNKIKSNRRLTNSRTVEQKQKAEFLARTKYKVLNAPHKR